MVYTGTRIKNVCCVGAGYVGGPSSAILALQVPDIEVTVVDKNPVRVAAWNSDELPFSEPGLLEAIKAARGVTDPSQNGTSAPSGRKPNLFFSTEVDATIRKADLIFVAVETPSGKLDGPGNGAAPDLTSFHAVLRHVARTVEKDFILVNKSTVPCGSADAAKDIISPHLKPGVECQILSNPEFLAEGTAVSDLLHPDRILIGSDETPKGRAAADALGGLYARWVAADRIITMHTRSSELSKLAANALLAQRISSINALSAVCDRIGADVTEVARACGLDHRIGRHMLRSTLGFGGSCFKKDVLHLTNTSAQLGLPDVAAYFESVVNINTYQTTRFTENIMSKVPSNPFGRRTVVGMLGFAFKPDTDDTRESPAIPVIRDLVVSGYHVNVFDPLVHEAQILQDLRASLAESKDRINEQVTICKDVYEACDGASGIAVLNSWKQLKYVPSQREGEYSWIGSKNMDDITFSSIEVSNQRVDWERISEGMQSPKYIFDGHNVLDRRLADLGFCIDGIGRPVAEPRLVEDVTPPPPEQPLLPKSLSAMNWRRSFGTSEKPAVQQLPASWLRFVPVVE
ncbi:nucleotide sugar dehydrogenase [Xylariomycetidae sp. FL2044]|nr:nucleotide sugar dehydrogenase [Xylariomycetidae sp. FL2044]